MRMEFLKKQLARQKVKKSSLIHREKILTMLENHYCAHPLTPGYASGPENGKVLESGP